MKKIIFKLLGFNLGLAFVDVFLFTVCDLWSLSTDEPLRMAATLTVLFLTVVLLIVVNYSILTPKNSTSVEEELESVKYELTDREKYKKYIKELESSPDNCMMRKEIAQAIVQIEGFIRKVDGLNELLKAHFEGDSYLPAIQEVIDEIDRTLDDNTVKILKRLAVNDEQEYMRLKAMPEKDELYADRMRLFEENIKYVRDILKQDEAMLLQFNQLMNEISRMNESSEENDLSRLSDMVSSMRKMREGDKDQEMENLKERYGG